MKWVKTISRTGNEPLDRRAWIILDYIFKTYGPAECTITDMDATGELGNELSDRWEDERMFTITEEQLRTLFNGDGQVIELHLYISGSGNFQVIIRDGDFLEILGGADIPDEIIGPHVDGDVESYFFE